MKNKGWGTQKTGNKKYLIYIAFPYFFLTSFLLSSYIYCVSPNWVFNTTSCNNRVSLHKQWFNFLYDSVYSFYTKHGIPFESQKMKSYKYNLFEWRYLKSQFYWEKSIFQIWIIEVSARISCLIMYKELPISSHFLWQRNTLRYTEESKELCGWV